MGKFKDLRVWADAMDLAAGIYRITQLAPFNRDYAFSNQIRRTAVSIPSNIAEGGELGTNREAVHFFNIAKGSAAELITQLSIACRIGYLDTGEMETMENPAEKIRASGKKLIQTRGGNNLTSMLLWPLITLLKPI